MEQEMHHHSDNEHHLNNELPIFDCIRTRRSVRKYEDKAVPWDHIVEIMQSAKYAPFAGNIFNMKLIVVKNENKRKSIAEASAQQHWMQHAPVHIVVVAEPEKAERFYGTRGIRLYTIQAIGAAIENMLLTAHSLGLGTCWVGAFDEEEIRRLCNMPEHVHVHAIITIGYPAEHPDLPPKYRIEHYMFFEKWWGRQEHPKWGIGHWAPVIKHGVDSTKKMIKKAHHKIKEKLSKKGKH